MPKILISLKSNAVFLSTCGSYFCAGSDINSVTIFANEVVVLLIKNIDRFQKKKSSNMFNENEKVKSTWIPKEDSKSFRFQKAPVRI